MINTAIRKNDIFTKPVEDVAEDHNTPNKFNQIETALS